MVSMRIMLEENLAACTTLQAVQHQTEQTFREFVEDGFSIRYVAGPVSCDGDEYITRNLQLLVNTRTEIMHELDGESEKSLIFTAPFIFTPEVYDRLGLFAMDRVDREQEMQRFWDGLILSGLIAGIYFRRGWERSPGSQREHSTALQANIPVTYL